MIYARNGFRINTATGINVKNVLSTASSNFPPIYIYFCWLLMQAILRISHEVLLRLNTFFGTSELFDL